MTLEMTSTPRPRAPRPTQLAEEEARALAAELGRRLRGEVRFDAGSRALYATDGSNYRQVPIGVVVPRDADDVVEAVAVCRRFGAPFLSRGAGTSLAGQCCNVAVVCDLSKYLHRILEIDPGGRRARVQPGAVLDDLRSAAERHHLTFGPDPASHSRCTLGGMIGNNSCGAHSLMAGKTEDNVLELEVLTYDGLRMRVGRTSEEELARLVHGGGRRGEIYGRLKALRDRYAGLIRRRYPQIPRRVSGYNLPQLLPENGCDLAKALVGSEGTCVTVLEATVRLVASPPARSLLVLAYADVYEAGDHVPEVLAAGPVGLEGLDDRLVEAVRKRGLHPRGLALLPPGGGWLLVELGGDTALEAGAKARALMDAIGGTGGAPAMRLCDDPREAREVWKVRESALGATARVPGRRQAWEGWEDSAVPPERVGAYLRALRALLAKHGYDGALYGHFGQGCIHTRTDFDLESAPGIARYRAFVDAAADLVLSFGGSLSGEHGDGQSRAELLPRMFGPELVEAFREFKSIWDPEWKMNPGKVVDPYRLDENLRLGPGYRPPQLATRFRFAGEDEGSFARATLRCVGVGECRKEHAGTMCPSYMATRDETHSTRGRARLLFEMLAGDPLAGMWRDRHVKEALDLCLACKACKSECPTAVDMATYKAEFLSHYYERRLRPRSAYAFGLVHRWARLASHVPCLANLATRAPGLSRLAKAIAGMAQEREIPALASRSFTAWFAGRRPPRPPVAAGGRQRVLLWPDTFNNYFHPGTARAAVEVLEAAGFEVALPRRALCCGRPLYDYGMLDLAKRQLRRILADLAPEIAAGIPVVGLEPSCVAVFRDEMMDLLPDDLAAQRLSRQTYLLAELLEERAGAWRPPRLEGRAIVHGHCHQKSILGMDADEAVLRRLGLDHELLDAGCCGMAGSFGFEPGEHYEVSIACGERVLLPAVRRAANDELIVADGFSCREQIAQRTDRRALHLAEVLQMALSGGKAAVLEPGGRPVEDGVLEARAAPGGGIRRAAMVAGGALVALVASAAVLGLRALGRARRRRRKDGGEPGARGSG
jgi:FAD/FMN-containing dehydrogenase/Fe-S oxidoreductase